MEEARWIRKDIWAACMGEPLERAVFSFQQGNTSSAYHASQAIVPGMAEDTGLGVFLRHESQAHAWSALSP